MACWWNRFAWAMIVLNVALMISVLNVVIFSNLSEPKACQKSDGAKLGELLQNITSEAMKKAVQERETAFQDAERFKSMAATGPKPKAYVVLASIQAEGYNANLRWNPNHSKSQLKGVEYVDNGYLRVLADGYYFIYSKLTFMERPGHSLGRDFIRQCMFWTEPRFGLRRKLPFFNELAQPNLKPGAVVSSEAGGMVYLPCNSTISVTVSLPDSLHPDSSLSYFELYLV